MRDTFAKLFNVGGTNRQLLVLRERDDGQDIHLIKHVTVIDGVRISFEISFGGEEQDDHADQYLEKFDQQVAENIYLGFLEEIFERGE